MSSPRILPSIEVLLRRPRVRALEAKYGRAALLSAVREEVTSLRAHLTGPDGVRSQPGTTEEAAVVLEAAFAERLRATLTPSLCAVINATGVILHTNLGRAPLAAAALQRIVEVAGGYSNLEYSLGGGQRGARHVHADTLLRHLTGAESAVVVNNNAAAALLVLSALASGREAIVSRGELVEIGGGFRVPDVMRQSGAQLREVGTTNRTRAADYAAAVGERTGIILRVHRSNFRIEGFTERPSLEQLVAVGRELGVPVVEDLGSGYLRERETPSQQPGGETSSGGQSPPSPVGALADEPTVQSSVAGGADIVFFSGDKLLGGPQAGIIVGRADLLDKLRRHPLMRALRVDKLTYAALEATLVEYSTGRARQTVPVARMLAATASGIDARAGEIVRAVADLTALRVTLIDGMSTVGGGSVPGAALPTRLLVVQLAGATADDLVARLRRLDPPVVARIQSDDVVLDLRTVLPEQDSALTSGLRLVAGRR